MLVLPTHVCHYFFLGGGGAAGVAFEGVPIRKGGVMLGLLCPLYHSLLLLLPPLGFLDFGGAGVVVGGMSVKVALRQGGALTPPRALTADSGHPVKGVQAEAS